MNTRPSVFVSFSVSGSGSLFLCLMLAALACGEAPQAQQPKESKEAKEAAKFYRFYTFYHSKWKIEEETAGKKKTYTGKCFGSAGGCNIFVGEQETSVWGYDPKTRQWTGVGQLDNGSRYVMAISRPPGPKFKPGMTFTFTGTIWHADGTLNYVTIKQTCVDHNTLHEVATGTDRDGKAIPKVTRTFKRVKQPASGKSSS